ncbi:phosphatase PAP2 family protein [Nocardia sp. NPDC127579]|uniref:phosphatase PAP2 family protein n=1 Tax=Nocardia sp. NPDC127579 TaxID=3345402 RepID=UPI0036454D87
MTVLVPLSFPAGGGSTDLDRSVADAVHRHVGADAYPALVLASNGPVVVALLLTAVAWFACRRRWWSAATMFVVPESTLAINAALLKPLWDRPLADYLAYPSGHTVHLVAVATTFVLLTDSTRARFGVALATALILAAVTIGMIGLGYHHLTDVLGGTAAAVALSIALCWVAARIRDRTDRPGSAAPS